MIMMPSLLSRHLNLCLPLLPCRQMAAQFSINLEIVIDLTSLALYDVVFYAGPPPPPPPSFQ